jgi:hypothetical protein
MPSASRLSRNAHGEGLEGNRRATAGNSDGPPGPESGRPGRKDSPDRRATGSPAETRTPGRTRAESRSFSFPSAHRRPEPPPRSARSPRMGRRGISFQGTGDREQYGLVVLSDETLFEATTYLREGSVAPTSPSLTPTLRDSDATTSAPARRGHNTAPSNNAECHLTPVTRYLTKWICGRCGQRYWQIPSPTQQCPQLLERVAAT